MYSWKMTVLLSKHPAVHYLLETGSKVYQNLGHQMSKDDIYSYPQKGTLTLIKQLLVLETLLSERVTS